MEIPIYPLRNSTLYKLMDEEKKHEDRTTRKFNFANKFVVPLYRLNILPLFLLGKIFILVKTKGRKTGKIRYVPLEYRKRGDKFLIFASRGERSNWYRNIIAYTDQPLLGKIGFKWHQFIVNEIQDVEDRVEIMKWYAQSFQSSAKALFGYDKTVQIEDRSFINICQFIRILELEKID